ncbi:MAG: iron ABC transporter permease [Nannocystaceae bacterium]
MTDVARGLWRWAVLAGLLIALAGAATVVGPGDFGLGDVADVFRRGLAGTPGLDRAFVILWELRFPRLVLVILVGAALAASGVVTQGMFRNPLAEPGLLGISAGAAAAVILGFAWGLDERALWVTPALAAGGASIVLALLYLLAGRQASSAVLLLTGVALSSVAGAVGTCVLSLSLDSWDFSRKALSWMLGSFDGRGWSHVGWTLPPIVTGLAVAMALHRQLDVLFLGEETAATMGLRRGRLRVLVALTVGLLVGASTAAVGVIGFIGLIVPHVARQLVPAGHARVLAASMLLGASLLVVVDTVTRAITPYHVAPGALTSLVGGSFFVWLLHRRRNEAGSC